MLNTKLTLLLVEEEPDVSVDLKQLAIKYPEIFNLICPNYAEYSVLDLQIPHLDLALIDVNLSLANSADICKIIKSQFPYSFIIGMQNQGANKMKSAMLQNGVFGFIEKTDTAFDILYEIDKVLFSRK